MISGDSVPIQARGVLNYRLADDMVVYDPVRSQAASLNGTARAVWDLCDGSRSVHMLCNAIVERFDVSPEEASTQVHDAVEQLFELGLLCV
jgi:hypothetical protein